MIPNDIWWFPVIAEGTRLSKTKQNRNPSWAEEHNLMRKAENTRKLRHENGLKLDWSRGGGWGRKNGDPSGEIWESYSWKTLCNPSQLGFWKRLLLPGTVALVVWSSHSEKKKKPRLSRRKPWNRRGLPSSPCMRGRYPDATSALTGKMKSRGNLEPGDEGRSSPTALASLWGPLLCTGLECRCFLQVSPLLVLSAQVLPQFSDLCLWVKRMDPASHVSPRAWLIIGSQNMFLSWMS